MMMLQEINTFLNRKITPKIYRLNSEIHGLQYQRSKSIKLIKKVMLTIDLSLDAIHYALKSKVNLIISNHSLINRPIKKFNQTLINKLALLSRYPTSIFVLSSPFIAVEGGVSDTIVDALFLKIEKPLEIKTKEGKKVPIGRICSSTGYLNNKQFLLLEELINRIKTNLNSTHIVYIGDLKKVVKKICVVGGDNSKIDHIKKAVNYGCDCYISGKINYNEAVFARDIGINLIETSPYKGEILALKKLCNILSLEFPYVEFLLFESKDPFKTYF